MKICPESSDFLIPLTVDSSPDHERSVSYNVVIFHLRLSSLQSDDDCSQFIIAMLLRSKGFMRCFQLMAEDYSPWVRYVNADSIVPK